MSRMYYKVTRGSTVLKGDPVKLIHNLFKEVKHCHISRRWTHNKTTYATDMIHRNWPEIDHNQWSIGMLSQWVYMCYIRCLQLLWFIVKVTVALLPWARLPAAVWETSLHPLPWRALGEEKRPDSRGWQKWSLLFTEQPDNHWQLASKKHCSVHQKTTWVGRQTCKYGTG